MEKKSPGEFAALAACLWSCLLVTPVLIFRLRAAYLRLLWVAETRKMNVQAKKCDQGMLLGPKCVSVCSLLFPIKLCLHLWATKSFSILELVRTPCGIPWALSLQWDICCQQIQHLPRHGMWWNSQTGSRVKRGVFAVLCWEDGLDFLCFQREWCDLGSFGALEVKFQSF